MFERPIINLINNISDLSEFVDAVSMHIEKAQTEYAVNNVKDLIPAFHVGLKYDPKVQGDHLITKESAELIFGSPFDFHVINENGVDVIQFEMREDARKRFYTALKKINEPIEHKNNIIKIGLVNLISYVEWYLSAIIHEYFEIKGSDTNFKDKSISFSELKKFGGIDDAKNYLIEKEIEGILRGDIEDWLNYLKNKFNLSMSYSEEHKEDLLESQKRRNIIIHNGGIANSIYLNSIAEKHRGKYKIGELVPVDRSYLNNAMSIFEKVFVLIGLELWKNIEKNSKARGPIVNEIITKQLKLGKYFKAEATSKFLLNDKGIESEFRTFAQINFWLSVKKQGRLDEIRSDIMNMDYSDKKKKFELAKHILLENEEEYLKIIEDLFLKKELSAMDIKELPIYSEIKNNIKVLDLIRSDTKNH